MAKKYPVIHIEGCQVKSRQKMKKLCKALDTLEKEIGIKVVEISFKDMFICPDIDLTEFSNSKDPMEKLVGNLFIKFDKMRYGKKSKYQKVK